MLLLTFVGVVYGLQGASYFIKSIQILSVRVETVLVSQSSPTDPTELQEGNFVVDDNDDLRNTRTHLCL